MKDEDYSFLVIEIAEKLSLCIHILCIYICNKCDAFLVTIKWLSVHIIEEKKPRNMKFLWIPHKWVLKSAFLPIKKYGTQSGFPTKKFVLVV